VDEEHPRQRGGAAGARPPTEPITLTELADHEKVPLLRAYLKRLKWEVGAFFGGVGPDSPDEELRRIAPDHPAFRIAA
jgi:hypothetical protein